MATSAESAKQWVESKNPSETEIQDVINKLESRIESWEGEADAIQGSIDAVDYLHAHLQSLAAPEITEPVNLDTSNLIPDAKPIELEKAIKDETFAALKAQLGKTLN